MFTLNCKGKLIIAEEPLVMGILNITDDSFYEGSRFTSIENIILTAKKMIGEKVDILDIGGMSTRPGSKPIKEMDEINRITNAIKAILDLFPETIISLDTYRSTVAIAGVEAGASIINDISGGSMDPEMIETVGKLNVPYICMHMKGTPENMYHQNNYYNLITEVVDYFIQKIEECKKAGINDIIIDPGFGFAKNIQQNFQLLKSLSVLNILDKPILAGLSRKSTIYKTLDISSNDALNGTTVLNTLALQNGANILRVHDVSEAKQSVRLFSAYKNA